MKFNSRTTEFVNKLNKFFRPVMVLPSLKENTIAVRCCPKYFKLRKNGPPSFVPVPYRMIFAVATNKSILLYDTQQMTPIAMISNIHYTRLTDVSWYENNLQKKIKNKLFFSIFLRPVVKRILISVPRRR